jgi:NADH:ubiquinone oxidoreductase subunit 4 (subunit M)
MPKMILKSYVHAIFVICSPKSDMLLYPKKFYLKREGYGIIRINMELLSHAHSIFVPWLVVIVVIQIVYVAFTSFSQCNLKRRIAYSLVSQKN